MRITESGCVSCGLPCLGKNCRHYEVTRYICDECGDETTLYEWDGAELCLDCIERLLIKVEGSDGWF